MPCWALAGLFSMDAIAEEELANTALVPKYYVELSPLAAPRILPPKTVDSVSMKDLRSISSQYTNGASISTRMAIGKHVPIVPSRLFVATVGHKVWPEGPEGSRVGHIVSEVHCILQASICLSDGEGRTAPEDPSALCAPVHHKW